MITIAIIGAGISGLATAFQIEKRMKEAGIPHSIHIFEREARTGGKILSASRDGFLCEAGPNGFLDSKPSTLELCKNLGLADQLLRSNDSARKRFIYSEGRLHEIPISPLRFFCSNLLSIKGRLRIIGELWAKGPQPGSDPTIAEFGRRRLGPEAFSKLLDPMVAGVFAGDAEKLSLASSFPRIAELEKDYGSLIRAMLVLKKKRSKSRSTTGGPAGPGGTLTSFAKGLSMLTDKLAGHFDGRITRNAKLESIGLEKSGFCLGFNGIEKFYCDCAIIAIPAVDAAPVFAKLDPSLATLLESFEFAPVSVVGLGFRKCDIKYDLNGFGFLIPKKEKRRILGNLWCSSIFSNRAPQGSVLLRTMVGGARSPELALLPENEIVNLARKELHDLLNISAEPVFTQVFKWERAICQYTVGHASRLKEVDSRLKNTPGLFLAGNSYRGIAINDCTLNAQIISDQVVSFCLTPFKKGQQQ